MPRPLTRHLVETCLSAVALAVLCLAVGSPAQADDGQRVSGRTLFTITDEDVFESSGLVDAGPVVYTTNDSGDDAVIYGFDAGTGRLVSRTTYAPEVDDVEALAPGRRGVVWAGDVGDNPGRRTSIDVYQVVPGRGTHERPARRYTFTYPDGPHDAETLLVHPRTGRARRDRRRCSSGARGCRRRRPPRPHRPGPGRAPRRRPPRGRTSSG